MRLSNFESDKHIESANEITSKAVSSSEEIPEHPVDCAKEISISEESSNNEEVDADLNVQKE